MAGGIIMFEEYIGQSQPKALLAPMIENALKNGCCLPPQGVLAPSGMGKTQVARAIADAIGVQLLTVYCTGKKGEDVVSNVCSAPAHNVVLLDEIHALKQGDQDILLPLLDALKRPFDENTGIDLNGEQVKVSPVSLLWATNRPDQVLAAIKTRSLIHRLEPYTLADMELMVYLFARKQGRVVLGKAAKELALASQCNPRALDSLMDALFRTLPTATTPVNSHNVVAYLEKLRGFKCGLSSQQQQYIKKLASNPTGLKLEHLVRSLGCTSAKELEENVEFWLLESGLVQTSSAGRTLTKKGINIAAQLED